MTQEERTVGHVAGRGKGSWTEQISNRRSPEFRLTEGQVIVHKKDNLFLTASAYLFYIKMK